MAEETLSLRENIATQQSLLQEQRDMIHKKQSVLNHVLTRMQLDHPDVDGEETNDDEMLPPDVNEKLLPDDPIA